MSHTANRTVKRGLRHSHSTTDSGIWEAAGKTDKERLVARGRTICQKVVKFSAIFASLGFEAHILLAVLATSVPLSQANGMTIHHSILAAS